LFGAEHCRNEEGKVLTGASLGKAQEEKAVISTAMANPETIFSEKDMLTRFLRSAHARRKGQARGGGLLSDQL
jgi:hypothetical protein